MLLIALGVLVAACCVLLVVRCVPCVDVCLLSGACFLMRAVSCYVLVVCWLVCWLFSFNVRLLLFVACWLMICVLRVVSCWCVVHCVMCIVFSA